MSLKLKASPEGLLPFALLAGLALRLCLPDLMEWKEDEQYHFHAAMEILRTGRWPWVGINSGVYLANPGLSIWAFAALARLSGATTPTGLVQALAAVSVIGLAWVAVVGVASLKEERSRELWAWAVILAAVNPFLVWMHRKLWPQGLLPFWIGWMLLGYWNRRTRIGAALWGFFGATLGQIHMAGFFAAGAAFLWELSLRRGTERRGVRWGAWCLASAVGALPLLPWLRHVAHQALGGPVALGAGELAQLRFWVFWFTDPTGVHLGNTLGVLNGGGQWAQIRDFLAYPMIGGQATYLSGVAHAIALGGALWIGFTALRSAGGRLRHPSTWLGTGEGDGLFLQQAQCVGCGLLMALPTFWIRRYYLAATYPWEFVFFARLAFIGREEASARRWLAALFAAQLAISVFFVHYLALNDGAPRGDYGMSYRAQAKP